VQEQTAFDFWPQPKPTLRASAFKAGPRPRYAIVTEEKINELFEERLLVADLLARSDGLRDHAAGWAVRETLLAIKKELEELVS
jgi:hypothetical protein